MASQRRLPVVLPSLYRKQKTHATGGFSGSPPPWR
jgi:hypothetical protein